MADHPSSRIVVVGLARSGIGAARLLRARGHQVLLIESRSDAALEARAAELRAEGIEVQLQAPLNGTTFANLGYRPDGVVVSPGIRWDHPALVELREAGINVCGELSPAWEATGGIPWIAITGTNGKTTVTHLVHHLLSRAGLDAPLCGNVGNSAAELALSCLGEGRRPDHLVVEVSSYQIEASADLAPAIGLWTTLTPDHLERHGTLDNYRAIKRSLIERSAVRILNADDADLRARAASWEQAQWITAGPRQALPSAITPCLWVENGQVCSEAGPLFPADCLAMPGEHNRQNLLLAAAVGLKLGLAPAVMEAALRDFPGVPHRLERIRRCGGVSWYNDSKATNYDAAEVALRALEGPLVVLAGGQSKVGEAGAWVAGLQRQARAVVLYGASREEFQELLARHGYSGAVQCCEGMEEAVPLAAALAQGCRAVLLSPACASFDQYTDFEARGDHFRRLVMALPEAEGAAA